MNIEEKYDYWLTKPLPFGRNRAILMKQDK
jgi:hypothetical protein